MLWRAFIVLALLFSSLAVRASEVTTYGAGLETCTDYVAATDAQTIDLVGFADWLSGYFSGVNTTSTHRNNFLNHEDLQAAIHWLYGYCQTHKTTTVAAATWLLVVGARTGSAAHSVETAAYGSGFKSCAVFRAAREEQGLDTNIDQTEFIAWLGGYLSGTNAMSMTTTNALGAVSLDEALHQLDDYCGVHTETAFAAAVQTLIASAYPDATRGHLADARVAPAPGTRALATSANRASSQ
jgi:hypothetical protein